jgi:DNA-binding LacI/PurR family transcriptional regulator
MMKSKMTISDIAKLANVSKTTVSFYLNGKFEKMSDETRQRIEKVIEKTGYEPSVVARSLNFKQTKLIGVIIGDITNSFANQIVKGIDAYARENGYQLIVGSSGYDTEYEKQYLRSMVAMGVDGFIVQPTVQFRTVYSELGISNPIVYFDSPNRDMNGLWIKTNNYEAVYEACDLMAEKGYEHFVIVTADPYVLATRLERTRGLTDNLDLRKLTYDTILANDLTSVEELKEKLTPILENRRNVCVFVASCWLLPNVFTVLKNWKKRIPDDIGLMGFDSLEWTELSSPTVTTIVQPAFEEGYLAGQVLIDRIEGKNEIQPNHILKCRINEMMSTDKQKGE